MNLAPTLPLSAELAVAGTHRAAYWCRRDASVDQRLFRFPGESCKLSHRSHMVSVGKLVAVGAAQRQVGEGIDGVMSGSASVSQEPATR